MKNKIKKILFISLFLTLIFGTSFFIQNKELNTVNASTTETYWEFKDEPTFTDGIYHFNFTLMNQGTYAKDCNTLTYSSYNGLQFITTENVLNTLYKNGWTAAYKYPFTVTSTLGSDTENWLKGFATEKFIVKYDLNGGTGTTPTDSNKYFIGNSVSLNNGSGISKSGYTFLGWSTNKTASTGTTNSYTISETDVVDHCITFYAIWTPVDYTITYNLNGGTNDSNNPVKYTIESETITFANPTKTGYTFSGWYTENTFSNIITTVTKGSTGDKSLYAKWTPVDYTITYNLDGGTNDSSNPVKYTIESEGITLANPTKTGYIFDGWYTENTFENKKTDIYQGSTGDITLYARWVNYVYTYSLANSLWDKTVETSYNQGDIIKFDLIGMSFTHYAIGANGIKAGNFGSNMPGFYTIVNTGATIELCTTPNIQVNITDVPIYTITYNLDGGTNSSNNPSTYKKSSTAITLEDPTKAGFSFLGWYDNSSFTGSAITTIQAEETGDKTLYAKWEEKATIIINDNIQRFIYDGSNKTPIIKDTSGNLITISGFNYTYDVHESEYKTCYESKMPGLYKINITRAEDETYKAVDTYIEYVVTYSVTYKANTGVGDDIIDDADTANIHIEYFGQYVETLPNKDDCDKQATIKGNTFTKENYTFSFWNTKQDGTGMPYYPDGLATLTENLVLYACYKLNINAQPTKNNNYTVGVGTTDAVTYIWEKEATVTTPVDLSKITVDSGTVNTSNNTITATLQSGKYTIIIVCKDFTKSLMFYTEGELTDGVTGDNNIYNYASSGSRVRLYVITSDQEFTISNINYYGSGYTEISSETSNSILNANENTNYRCKIKSIFNGITYSDVIKPNSISFNGNTGSTGTEPSTMYQLEGRKITVPLNPFTNKAHDFLGWNTDKDAVTPLTFTDGKYEVGNTNTTLYAIWGYTKHTCDNIDYLIPLTSSFTGGTLSSGSYYLYEDITLTNNITIDEDTNVSICLNGKTLYAGMYGFITHGDLTLTNCIETGSKKYFNVDDTTGIWTITDTETNYSIEGGSIIKTGGGYVYCAIDVEYERTLNLNNITMVGACGTNGYTISIYGSANVSNSKFYGNVAEENGGAIYLAGALNLYDSIFKYNVAKKNGGAIYATTTDLHELYINGCIFEYNKASQGSAIYIDSDNAVIKDTTIKNNICTTEGHGALEIYGKEQESCLAEGTLILMSNGKYKRIENILIGDQIKSFDHETGSIVTKEVFSIFKEDGRAIGLKLHFSDNNSITICGKHCFLEKESLKYISISIENVNDYIGKEFYNALTNKFVKLVNYDTTGLVHYYSIMSKDTINVISNQMLTVSDPSSFILNVFDFDSNLKINDDLKQIDINTYGLASYDEFYQVCLDNGFTVNEDIYNNFKMKYAYIVMGKGIKTLSELFDSLIVNGKTNKIDPLLTFLSFNPNESYSSFDVGENILLLGSNVVIKDNISGTDKYVNIFFEGGLPRIHVIDGSTGINVGVTLNDTFGEFAENIYTNDNSNVKFICDYSDDYLITIDKITTGDDDNVITTYNYSISGYKVIYNVDITGAVEPTDTTQYKDGDNVTLKDFSIIGYIFKGWSKTQNGSIISSYSISSTDASNGIINLYAIYIKVINTEPTKDNDYTVVINNSIKDDVTYEWQKLGLDWIDATEVELYYNNFNNGSSLTVNTVTVSSEFFLTVSTGITSLRFKFSGDGSVSNCTYQNGYYYPTFDTENNRFNVQITDKGENDKITDIEAYSTAYVSINNQTNDQFTLSTLENTKYRCLIKYNNEVVAYSIVLTPIEISFEDSTGATGEAPDNIYELEGRKITIPLNTFTKTGFTFIGWTLTSVYQANDKYTVSSNDVIFKATWKGIENVSINKTSQPHTYSGASFSFVIDGNIETGFIIYYAVHLDSNHLESDWVTTSPIYTNSYDVRITRLADDSYYSYDDEIKNGLVINKATYNMANAKWNYTNAFTYDGDEKEVTVTGLPTGVTASYENNKATNVSLYTAKAILSYDTLNYNSVAIPDLDWEILKANAVITLSSTDAITVNKGDTITLPTASSNFGEVTCNTQASNLVNAGTYTVTYTVDGTSNYNGATKSITVKINNLEYQNEVLDNLAENEVKVESSKGLDSSINLEVTVKAVANNILNNLSTIIDYSKNLKSNERISKLYDIKLIITEQGLRRELTKDELEDGTEFTVRIKVPTDLDGKSFKLLHVHSASDVTEVIKGTEAKVGEYILDTDGYLVTKIDKFSEFAFIYEVDEPSSSFPWWAILLIVLGLLIIIFVGLFFIWKAEYDKAVKLEEDLNDRKLRFLDILYLPISKLIFKEKQKE